jgi:hypothetical protein
MPIPIQPGALVDGLYQFLRSIAPNVRRANDFRGGGGYENWTLVQFLLAATSTADYDYRREAPYARARIDIAFNENNIAMPTPLIWTEWKCNPNANTLSVGFTGDIQKLVRVLTDFTPGQVLPLPLILGVGPEHATFPGCAGYPIDDRESMFMYTSTAATWEAMVVYDKTWYSQLGSAEEGDALLSAALRAGADDGSGEFRMTLTR